MSEQKNFKNIPIVSVNSGEKYKTTSGIVAIKDGIKANSQSSAQIMNKKPAWLKIKLAVMGEEQEKYQAVKKIVQERSLSTVCEEAKCPNISECWSHGTATIMLLGSVCTRACKFCSVDTGNPHGWLDLDEPEKAAQSAALMGLKYIVLTSVDRDDLPDGGADHYAKAIKLIKQRVPDIKVEALTPDFQGNFAHVQIILDSGVDVFAQNLETVERLTKQVRDVRASYQQTLDVLSYSKRSKSSVLTKSSLMLGLGEKEQEVQTALRDLRAAQVDIVTLGQYLQPTPNHLPVIQYIPPADFAKYREFGLQLGFLEVAAGPMVRSSYRADRVFAKNNLDL